MKRTAILMGGLFFALLLVACSGNQAFESGSPEGLIAPSARAASDSAPLIEPGGRAGAPAPQLAPAAPESGPGGSSIFGEDRLIIFTANVAIRVEDVPSSVDALIRIADQYRGYVAGSNFSEGGGSPFANVTLKVPAENFQAALDTIRGIAERVLSVSVNSEDVTEEFTDLDARLRSLKATEEQLIALLNRADTIEDILKVRQQLTQVRVDIERIEGRLNYLERRAELATITVSLSERPDGIVAQTDWEPLRIVAEAWAESIEFLQTIATGLIRLVVFFWWLIVPGLLALLVMAVGIGAARRRN